MIDKNEIRIGDVFEITLNEHYWRQGKTLVACIGKRAGLFESLLLYHYVDLSKCKKPTIVKPFVTHPHNCCNLLLTSSGQSFDFTLEELSLKKIPSKILYANNNTVVWDIGGVVYKETNIYAHNTILGLIESERKKYSVVKKDDKCDFIARSDPYDGCSLLNKEYISYRRLEWLSTTFKFQ